MVSQRNIKNIPPGTQFRSAHPSMSWASKILLNFARSKSWISSQDKQWLRTGLAEMVVLVRPRIPWKIRWHCYNSWAATNANLVSKIPKNYTPLQSLWMFVVNFRGALFVAPGEIFVLEKSTSCSLTPENCEVCCNFTVIPVETTVFLR